METLVVTGWDMASSPVSGAATIAAAATAAAAAATGTLDKAGRFLSACRSSLPCYLTLSMGPKI